MKKADDHMKLPRYTEVEQDVGEKEMGELGAVRYLGGAEVEVVIHEAVQEEMNGAAQHPSKPRLVDLKRFATIVRATQRLVVYDRKQREARVRQHEEVGQGFRRSGRLLRVLQ